MRSPFEAVKDFMATRRERRVARKNLQKAEGFLTESNDSLQQKTEELHSTDMKIQSKTDLIIAMKEELNELQRKISEANTEKIELDQERLKVNGQVEEAKKNVLGAEQNVSVAKSELILKTEKMEQKLTKEYFGPEKKTTNAEGFIINLKSLRSIVTNVKTFCEFSEDSK